MKPIYTLVLVSLFFFSSCGLFVRTVVGVNPYAEWRTEAQLQDDVEEFGLSNTPF